MYLTEMARDTDKLRAPVNTVMNLQVPHVQGSSWVTEESTGFSGGKQLRESVSWLVG